MRVLATQLTIDVSGTFAEENNGWRFVSWEVVSAHSEVARAAPPTDALNCRFATAEDAIAFFRDLLLGDGEAG